MTRLTILFAALLVVVNTATIPSGARYGSSYPSSSPSSSPSVYISPSSSPSASPLSSVAPSSPPSPSVSPSSAPSPSQSGSAVSSRSRGESTSSWSSPSPSPSPTKPNKEKAPSATMTPSPSPSATPLQSFSRGPFQTFDPATVVLTAAQAPLTAGEFLGRVGFETPGFRTACLKCCGSTASSFSSAIPVLRSCTACALDKNLEPSKTGTCAHGASMGYSKTPTDCFYNRCHRMLLAKGSNCMCFGTRR